MEIKNVVVIGASGAVGKAVSGIFAPEKAQAEMGQTPQGKGHTHGCGKGQAKTVTWARRGILALAYEVTPRDTSGTAHTTHT